MDSWYKIATPREEVRQGRPFNPEEDRKDYFSAARTRATNKKWTAHEDLKKELGL